jgi:Arc/MetJ-type ribon-helix-helix transcriptional regulator
MIMNSVRLAITLDEGMLQVVDLWVKQGRYPNRSQAIQTAVQEKMERWRQTRLTKELAKLDRREEQSLADEGFAGGEPL